MTKEWVRDLCEWSAKLDYVGQKHGLMPALRDYFCEYIAQGLDIEDAACEALEACEITHPIEEL